eukprot:g1209.t1
MRFALAIFHHKDLLASAFRGKSKDEIDDKSSVSSKVEFFDNIVRTFNDETYDPSFTVPDGVDLDDINVEIIRSLPTKKMMTLDRSKALSKYQEFTNTYAVIERRYTQSGSNSPDIRGYCSCDVDMAYWVLRSGLGANKHIGTGLLPVQVDTERSGSSSPAKRRRTSPSSEIDKRLLTLLERSLATDEQTKDPTLDLLDRMVKLKQMKKALDASDPDHRFFDRQISRIRKSLLDVGGDRSDDDDDQL